MFTIGSLLSGYCFTIGAFKHYQMYVEKNKLKNNIVDFDHKPISNFHIRELFQPVTIVKINQVIGENLYTKDQHISGQNYYKEKECFFEANFPSNIVGKSLYYKDKIPYQIKYMYYFEVLDRVLKHHKIQKIDNLKFDSLIFGVYEKTIPEVYLYGQSDNLGNFYLHKFSESKDKLVEQIVESNHEKWYFMGLLCECLQFILN